MRICELREKEVVNVCDGERLGNICDIDFEERRQNLYTCNTGPMQNIWDYRT